MKKRIIAVILAMVMLFALGLSACGNNNEPSASDPTPTPDANTPDTDAPDTDDPLKVAIVVNQRFGDNGPMDNLAAGADRAVADFGVEVRKLESDAANFEEDVRAMSADYDLIITTFGYMSDATMTVANENPDKNYAAIFQFINIDGTSIPNIWDTEFHGEQAFFLNGYIAGKLTKTGVVGMIVGAEEPTPNAEANGFMQGVKLANPDATVEFAFVGSYEDPAKAKEITIAMIANGADIIQTDSGASNAGVVEACSEAGVLCSGEITDFYNTYEGFFGIVGIGFGDVAYQAIEACVNGKFPGGEHGIMGLSNGGYFMDWDSYVRFAEGSEEYGEAMTAVIAEAQELEEQVINGEIEVPFNTEVPNWANFK